MKKILLMLTMVLVLGFSAICSASNGKVLDAEEAMVNKFLAASNYSATGHFYKYSEIFICVQSGRHFYPGRPIHIRLFGSFRAATNRTHEA